MFQFCTGILEKHNYAQQVHEVLTEDGYLLTINRILSKNTSDPNPKVVFLNHGFLQSAYYWLIRGPPDALGFVLADAGYDVWLINNRGNGDSMTAVHPPATDDFWNFGHDEIGLYDTPAAIDYILDETNQTDLTFVCHSQGCTMYYIMCLEKPEYEVKINKLIGLAPFFDNIFKYNYGPTKNLQIYGTTSPPIYNLTLLEHSPKYLFYGDLDYTVSPRSFEHSLKQLSNVHQVIRIDGYAHCEFTFGWSVYSKVNTKILSILQDKN
ncbi:LOW QUALITY PROTEIN: lipase 3-like [Atheta coriaria]|uniref:LOW QUALITY PROTEIN: lipase 3-like n=1 Tax=Dalotia coriaria TaxID=877792 RepID=UPI0031F36A87